MHQFTLPVLNRFDLWRKQARQCAEAGLPAGSVSWVTASDAPGLFAEAQLPKAKGNTRQLQVPKAFVDLARILCAHEGNDPMGLLYQLLLRLADKPHLLSDRSDPDVARARQMEKSVRRDMHKMKAFVRFREMREASGAGDNRRFFAWFEPSHQIVELTAPFFARRFADMDWVIATPSVTAIHEAGRLHFEARALHKPAIDDPTEELWKTYFTHIFNPARLKVKAMCAEMPRKYWKNLPEAETIPLLIRQAETRCLAMQKAPAAPVPTKAARIKLRQRPIADEMETEREEPMSQRPSIDQLRLEAKTCTRCQLCEMATQTVFGDGPQTADLMIVGEQPGDLEDLEGRPFIGPAGQLFDKAAANIGLDRSKCYVTNAVKHFKFRPAGKRRIHQRPEAGEIEKCRWWLDREIAAIGPKLILAMGATALTALTGDGANVLKRRGSLETGLHGIPVFVTVHPSFLLRLPDERERAIEEARFSNDLAAALELLRKFAR